VWSITLKDETDSSTTMRGSFAQDTPASTALADLLGLVSAVHSISDCIAVRASVTYRTVYLPIGTPGIGAKSADEGVFALKTVEDDSAVVSVPGISRSKLTTSGCLAGFLLDLSDSDISLFTAALISDIWCDPFGISLQEAISAYIRETR